MKGRLPVALAIAVAVVSVSPGCGERRSTEQTKAAAKIRELGGAIDVDEKDRSVTIVDLSETKITDAALMHLRVLTKLRDLDLRTPRSPMPG